MDIQKKNQLQQAGVLVLLGLFGIVMFSSLKSMGFFGAPVVVSSIPAMPAAELVTSSLPNVAQEAPGMSASPGEPAEFSDAKYTAETLRDPLVSLLPKPEPIASSPTVAVERPVHVPQPPSIDLEGVIWGANARAIIGGRVYAVGDKVSGSRIVAINARGIVVENQGRQFDLPVSDMQRLSRP